MEKFIVNKINEWAKSRTVSLIKSVAIDGNITFSKGLIIAVVISYPNG
jgi:serine protease inhibitor